MHDKHLVTGLCLNLWGSSQHPQLDLEVRRGREEEVGRRGKGRQGGEGRDIPLQQKDFHQWCTGGNLERTHTQSEPCKTES